MFTEKTKMYLRRGKMLPLIRHFLFTGYDITLAWGGDFKKKKKLKLSARLAQVRIKKGDMPAPSPAPGSVLSERGGAFRR